MLVVVTFCGCSLFDNLDRFSPQDGGASRVDAGKQPNARVDAGSEPADDGGMLPDAGDAGEQSLGCERPETLCVRLDRFTPHIGELVGVDLVTADNILRARALLDPLAANGGSEADIVMPLAIPASDVPAKGQAPMLQLEIYGDHNHDRMYTPDGTDHDWKVDLPASGNLVFTHNSAFSRLLPRPAGIGGDFHMHFEGMTVHIGQILEVMVIESDSGRAVGLYRLQSVPSDTFDIAIPEIIDVGGVTYRIEFFADANGNGTYDDPPTDHAWVKFAESGATGLDFTFVHGTDFTPLDYQYSFTP